MPVSVRRHSRLAFAVACFAILGVAIAFRNESNSHGVSATADNLGRKVSPAVADPRLEEVHQRSAAKHALVEELIAGRRSLLSVAGEFEALDAGLPVQSTLQAQYPNASFDEAYCRLVLAHVERSYGQDNMPESVRRRLAEELTAVAGSPTN